MARGVFCLLLMLAAIATAEDADSLARGWGDSIAWKDLKSGLEEAKMKNKPLMLLIHKSWCGACKSLKPKFAESTEIAEMSSSFVMVNTLDDEEPKEEMYAPDGGYIPRIFFLNPNGEVMSEVYNESGSPQYKYFYANSDSIVTSMKKVAQGRGMANTKEDL